MADLTLYIGNKNYSSWSLRAWLVLTKAGIDFDEHLIPLDVPGFKAELLKISDAGTVPVLKSATATLPDSLAISKWAAGHVPQLWPSNAAQKAKAVDVVRRMHTGFEHIRREAPMNLRRRTSRPMPQSCLDDAAEIDALWCECLSLHDGPFLFDDWSIADAFYAPVATRFESYGLPRSAKADTYISELMSDADYQDWEADAFIETWKLPKTDAVNL